EVEVARRAAAGPGVAHPPQAQLLAVVPARGHGDLQAPRPPQAPLPGAVGADAGRPAAPTGPAGIAQAPFVEPGAPADAAGHLFPQAALTVAARAGLPAPVLDDGWATRLQQLRGDAEGAVPVEPPHRGHRGARAVPSAPRSVGRSAGRPRGAGGARDPVP